MRNPYKVSTKLPITNKEFWVTNICFTKDISIDDLRVRIRRGCSINLLDRKHYSLTEDQINKSLENGSLKRKGHVLKIRQVAPEKEKLIVDFDKNPRLLKKVRNVVEIETPQFEELDFDDEKEAEAAFASENADADFADTAPALAVDKKFINTQGFTLQTPDQYFNKK
jgi:hypothetical protein